jgi:hypothetical protein
MITTESDSSMKDTTSRNRKCVSSCRSVCFLELFTSMKSGKENTNGQWPTNKKCRCCSITHRQSSNYSFRLISYCLHCCWAEERASLMARRKTFRSLLLPFPSQSISSLYNIEYDRQTTTIIKLISKKMIDDLIRLEYYY